MILCVNANAAIDKTVIVNQFRLNEIRRPQQVLATAGGKGANVARSLKRLGERPVIAGWVGGYNGRFIEDGLLQEGIETAFVTVDFESRTCLSILDPENNTLTELYEKGDPVPPHKVAEFTALFESAIARYSAVTFSGSLPPGAPDDYYATLLGIARAAGVPGLLDSSGEALRRGLEAGPALIKPNASEFADLVGRPLAGIPELTSAAVEVAARYRTIVVVSLGAEGALAVQDGRVLHIRPPQVTIKSAVGSGDCMLAGITYGLTHGFPLDRALRSGVAAGTANALTVGAGVFTLADFERIQTAMT